MSRPIAGYRLGAHCLGRLRRSVACIAAVLLLLSCNREGPESERMDSFRDRIDRVAGTPHGAWFMLFHIPVKMAPGRDTFVVVNGAVIELTPAQMAVTNGFRGPVVLMTSAEAVGYVWTKETGALPFAAQRRFQDIQHVDGVLKVTMWCSVWLERDDKASSASLRVTYSGPPDV